MDIPQSMRAYQLHETDDGVRGHFINATPEDLGEGDVLVRTTYSSVNYKDGLAGTGKATIARTLPLIGGCDGTGVVVHAGESGMAAGQRVAMIGASLSERHAGGYCEYMRVPNSWVDPLPDHLGTWEAAVFATAGVTAAAAILRLEAVGITPSSGPVVVTGASGGAGTLGVAMLAQRGYEVTAVTGKPEAAQLLTELGAAEIQPRPDLSGKPRALEHGHWAAAVDNVGGDTLAWLIRTMQPGGAIASYGNAGGNALHTTVLPFILRGISLLGVNVTALPFDLRHRIWTELAGKLPLETFRKIGHTVDFDDLPAAHERIVTEGVIGRTVVHISDVDGAPRDR